MHRCVFVQNFIQKSLLFQPMTVVYRVSRGQGIRVDTYLSGCTLLADGGEDIVLFGGLTVGCGG